MMDKCLFLEVAGQEKINSVSKNVTLDRSDKY